MPAARHCDHERRPLRRGAQLLRRRSPSPPRSRSVSLLGLSLSLQRAAELAWRAETGFVGVPCGIMDQFASALAQERSALHVWCDTARTERVRCDENVLIFDTGVTRGLRQSAFATQARRVRARAGSAAAAAPDARAPRARDDGGHRRERARRRAAAPRDARRAGERAREGGRSSRSRAPGPFPASCSSRRTRRCATCTSARRPSSTGSWSARVAEAGVRGARLTGAGWGGCAIATGEPDALSALAGPLEHEYARTVPALAAQLARAPRRRVRASRRKAEHGRCQTSLVGYHACANCYVGRRSLVLRQPHKCRWTLDSSSRPGSRTATPRCPRGAASIRWTSAATTRDGKRISRCSPIDRRQRAALRPRVLPDASRAGPLRLVERRCANGAAPRARASPSSPTSVTSVFPTGSAAFRTSPSRSTSRITRASSRCAIRGCATSPP